MSSIAAVLLEISDGMQLAGIWAAIIAAILAGTLVLASVLRQAFLWWSSKFELSGKPGQGQLPIGGVFWVNYRTDRRTLVESVPSSYAKANLQYFSESIRNWEVSTLWRDGPATYNSSTIV